jgi:uncharacterized protein YceH (UPF0502 family)
MPPLVVKLSRVPGERADRYGQTLAPDGAAARAEQASAAVAPVAAAPAAPAAETPRANVTDESLVGRVEKLEREIEHLKALIESFRAAHG